ncbi:MAG TPA: PGF-pre-PGF domain-containing protein [Candidatus Nanoarchaeia archaeon]|nr:PGF-pre-PGF domain-containing protein [Candidatus Nanoarchaeia archaeon]
MKKGLKGLFVLMIIGIVALVIALNVNMVSMNAVVSLLGAGNNATGTANGNFQNLSSSKGTFLLNASFIANGTTNSTLTNVTFMFSNNTDPYMYNTTIFNTSANQTYFQNTSFNIGLLADGVYNLSVNYTNSSSDSGQNISSAFSGNNITIDNTAPNVTLNVSSALSGIPSANGSNFSASKGNVSINFTIYDFKPAHVGNGLYQANLFNISEVRFVFDNGTGTDFNISSNLTGASGNGTVDNRSGVWTVNYNLSSLFEGSQGVIVYVNDTHNNTRVVIFNFTIDRTAPVMSSLAASSISATGAKVTVVTNESVANCTYASVAGAQGSAGSGNFSPTTAGTLTSYTKTFSSLTASTGYNIEVTCTDFVGYQITNGLSWATSAAAAASSNGGGGSGGSSGGVSTGVAGQFEKKVWTSINAGETASVELKKGDAGVTELSFSVPTVVYGAWVQVAKRDSLPSSVSKFDGTVYKTLEITKGPALNKEGAFTDAAIKFKVAKSWLDEKKLTKEAVALHHFADGKWTQLQTQVGEDDGTYVHYSSKTPGFSYFVIGQKSGEVAAPAAGATEQPAAEEPATEPTAEPAMEQKGMSKGLLVGLLVALVVIIAVVLWMRKRK